MCISVCNSVAKSAWHTNPACEGAESARAKHRENLWERISLGQNDLGRKGQWGEWDQLWGPCSSPACPGGLSRLPRVCSKRRVGSWPQKALLHQKMPEFLISSVLQTPQSCEQPALDTARLRQPSWPAHPPPQAATVTGPARQEPSPGAGGKEGWCAGPSADPSALPQGLRVLEQHT